jgi:uncharacterized protein YaeQ
MALKAIIFKAEMAIADMDRHYYHTHALTLARHPSETDERMMVRLLTFALHADEALQFTKGLSNHDEPDLWQKDLSGDIELWIDLGQPEEKRIRKACGRAKSVVIYCYSSNASEIWWQQNRNKLERFDNLSVIAISTDTSQQLATLAQRTMRLQCTIEDGGVWLGDHTQTVEVGLTHLKLA